MQQAEVRSLEKSLERVKASIRDVDTRVGRVSQTATRVGDRLATADGGRARALEAMELIAYMQVGSAAEAMNCIPWQPLRSCACILNPLGVVDIVKQLRPHECCRGCFVCEVFEHELRCMFSPSALAAPSTLVNCCWCCLFPAQAFSVLQGDNFGDLPVLFTDDNTMAEAAVSDVSSIGHCKPLADNIQGDTPTTVNPALLFAEGRLHGKTQRTSLARSDSVGF